MELNDQVYVKLQRHLDRQPIGFPATRSGAEIRILKHIFSPLEAAIACCLSYRPEPLQTVFRKKKSMEGTDCRVTDRGETCLAIGDMAQPLLQNGSGREVSREEAAAILELNQQQGLVLQPSNTRQAEFICSCCGCCCGMLTMHKLLPRPLDFWASNFQAVVDTATCKACGACEKRCQVGAVSVTKNLPPARVDPNRCIGCGVCVPTCPTGSISLRKKAVEISPPRTREELYDIIMANKKRRLGKLKLTGKLLADAVRTRQTHLLKPPSN